jgi:hypothetical protein
MMADLMDQQMRDDSAQGLFVVAPVVEDRPAVQPDHVWHVQRRAGLYELFPEAALNQIDDIPD